MDGLDGSGRLVGRPADLSDDYFSLGVIRNRDGHSSLRGSIDAINTNAVFESARKLSQCVRIIPRGQFVAMSYDGSFTYLWFLPHATILGETLDQWEGIRDAIAHEPPPLGHTNEWLLHLDLKGYREDVGSVWKPNAYSDIFCWSSRFHYGSPEVGNDKTLCWHFAYGQTIPVVGTSGGTLVNEAMDGYTYARLGTTWFGHTRCNYLGGGTEEDAANQRKFYKSCPIYKPPYRIEEVLTIPKGGIEYVRVKIVGRLQSTYGETGGAESTFSDDVGSWTRSNIEAEPYRTDENGLRLYLVHQATGFNPTWVMGDFAANSTFMFESGPSHASIFPSVFLTKEIPKPAVGAPLWHDWWAVVEFYLRALCEGYVDPNYSARYSGCRIVNPGTPDEYCDSDPHGMYDYTFANCCFDAFGGRWLPSFGSETTSETGADDIRTDKPLGVGPLPTTRCMAEVFNAFAAFIDKLRSVRVELPLGLEKRVSEASAATDFHPAFEGGDGNGCVHVGTKAAPEPSYIEGWVPFDYSLSAVRTAELASADYMSSALGLSITTPYGWYAFRRDVDWRVAPDQDALLAIPASWRDQINVHLQIWGKIDIGTSQPVNGGPQPFRCGNPDCTLEDYLVWNDSYPAAPELYSTLDCQDFGSVASRDCLCTLSAGMRITAPPAPPCLTFFWEPTTGRVCHNGGAAWANFTPYAGDYLALAVPFTDEL